MGPQMLTENPATPGQRVAVEAVISKIYILPGKVSKMTADPVRKQMPLNMETHTPAPPFRKTMI